MSRCVIISAGPFCDADVLAGLLLPDDYVIAADRGWHLATAMGVTPAVLVADFDSLDTPPISDDVKVIPLPQEKDETDTAYAMKMAYEQEHRHFLLLGCTGGRMDHQQAAMITAADYARKGCEVVLADEKNEIHFLTPGAYSFPANSTEMISFFAFAENVEGLFADGLYYEINDMTLTPYDPLCVSNRCLEEDFQIVFKRGLLLVYFSKD